MPEGRLQRTRAAYTVLYPVGSGFIYPAWLDKAIERIYPDPGYAQVMALIKRNYVREGGDADAMQGQEGQPKG